MKTNRSITLQMFFTILPVFLLVLALQMAFFGKYLSPLYSDIYFKNMHSQINDLSKDISLRSINNNSAILHAYAVEHETPVLVVTKDSQIVSFDLFNYLSVLVVEKPEIGLCRVLMSNKYELPNIPATEKLTIEASQLGDSSYYEPYIIRSESETYYYQSYNLNLIENKPPVEDNTEVFVINRSYYSRSDNNLMTERARIIYDLMKECLISKADIESHLNSFTKEHITDERGTIYRVIALKQKIEDESVFFITIVPIMLLEQETNFFINSFYIIFSILGVLLSITIFILSRKLSSPLVKLANVTGKLATQDFSVRAVVDSRNEVGQLSESINLLADNLQNAIVDLQQSADYARNNEERMKKLLEDLAHEFKTPLGIISLNMEVIRNEMFEEEPEHYFGTIEHEIEGLTHMVDEAIQLTKLQTGYWKYCPTVVYLNELIEVVLRKFSQRFELEGFIIKTYLTDVAVIADVRLIEQVFTNLVSNAVKYSGEEKIIEISATQDKNTVTINVINHGHIPEHELNHIWNRYYRSLEKTAPAQLQSQGIGLEIVKYILTTHQSDFGVRQDSDKVCFYFTLQAVDECAEE